MRLRFLQHVPTWTVLAGAGMLGLTTTASAQTTAPGGREPALVVKSPYASDARADVAVTQDRVVVINEAAPAAPCDKPHGAVCYNETYVSWIDSAVPFSHVRFRLNVNGGYDSPDRAGYVIAVERPYGGQGYPLAETKYSYEEFTAYIEAACSSRLSFFAEVPFRTTNPSVNEGAEGVGDINAGAKLALLRSEYGVFTVQLKVYLPTGDAAQGLGNDMFTFEPGVLFNHKIGDCCLLEGELKYWTPTDDEHNVIIPDGLPRVGKLWQWGLGVSYNSFVTHGCRLVPVVEVQGWYIEDGLVGVPPAVIGGTPLPPFQVEEAGGDHIMNAAIGARFGVGDTLDAYVGYANAITSRHFADHMWRLEVRWSY